MNKEELTNQIEELTKQRYSLHKEQDKLTDKINELQRVLYILNKKETGHYIGKYWHIIEDDNDEHYAYITKAEASETNDKILDFYGIFLFNVVDIKNDLDNLLTYTIEYEDFGKSFDMLTTSFIEITKEEFIQHIKDKFNESISAIEQMLEDDNELVKEDTDELIEK